MSNILKAVIIDEKQNRIDKIKTFLPEYIDFGVATYGDGAKAEIIGSNDGKKCNVVIMYGDDIKGQSVHMFDWLKNSGAVPGLEYIPVVILTKDEFSERSLEILEIGDCFFYEGEIEDDEFYSVVMEAIESYDDELEEDEPLFAETKSSEKIMGMSYVLPSEPAVMQRTMVLSDDEMIKGIHSSIESGKKETAEIREILTKTYEEAVKRGEELSWAPKTKEERSVPKKITFNEPEESFEIRKKKYLQGGLILDETAKMQYDEDDDEPFIPASVNDIHEFKDKVKLMKLFEELFAEDTDSLAAPQGNMNVMQGTYNNMAGVNMNMPQMMGGQMVQGHMPQQMQNSNVIRNVNASSKKKILVIDNDEQSLNEVKSIVGDSCIVEGVNSPMKAIDYFVSGYADVVIIEYNLNSMNALQVVQSIKLQAGGQRAKVVVLLSMDEMQYYQTVATSPHVSGILGKPIPKNQLEALL